MIKKNFLTLILCFISIIFAPKSTDAAFLDLSKQSSRSQVANLPLHPDENQIEMPAVSKKPTLKQKLTHLFAHKQANKHNTDDQTLGAKAKAGEKSQVVALVLCFFLGVLGIHRFYLGYTGLGILYLFTGGLLGVGCLIDLILLIFPNGLTPKGQSSY